MARLKLATYNINGIRARLGALLEWLDREQPDIVCLQELKAPDEAFPAGDLEAHGYGAIWHGQKSWNGVALLARGAEPVERRRGLPRDPDPAQSRYLEAEIHGLVVGALYLPNGNPWPGPKFDYKLVWFQRLIAHARSLLDEGRPVVLAGDFNVVPTDELDIYDPKSWRKDALLQPESRAAWSALLEQGWTDALRHVHGETKVFTFWDYFRRHWERDAGLRIDHLLLDPQLAPMLRDAGVDRWVRGRPGASDHAPTWVLLDTDGDGSKRATRKGTNAAKGTATSPGAVSSAGEGPRRQKASQTSSPKTGTATKAVARPDAATPKRARTTRTSTAAGAPSAGTTAPARARRSPKAAAASGTAGTGEAVASKTTARAASKATRARSAKGRKSAPALRDTTVATSARSAAASRSAASKKTTR